MDSGEIWNFKGEHKIHTEITLVDNNEVCFNPAYTLLSCKQNVPWVDHYAIVRIVKQTHYTDVTVCATARSG